MLPEYGQIGPLTFRTYTVLLDIAVLLGLALLVWQGHRRDARPLAWLDTGLAALVGGIIGARLVHAAIHWEYFSEHPIEIAEVWRGGLSWQGAVVGGLLALFVAARISRLDWRDLTDAVALVLPFGAMLAYAGCLASGCSAGREVATLADYPPLVAAELPDIYGLVVPRLASQVYGLALGLVLLGLAWALRRWLTVPGLRLWPVLALLAFGVFGIGFTLGSDILMLGSLRLDQLLDLLVAALAGVMGAVAAWMPAPPRPTRRADLLTSQQGVRHAD
ncbi:MAG TPA: prolipoprotein diacylglyceryl transferase [Aggregatilineales bacterium]|nr:prolipoprotein diacylglyceryl transferase [Aggregatilineales bacterium]HPV07333.1 prolipoprotein diacylglyceryl transferase [Aggregatilineales bacterium]HQA69190.1 prolipoprotein diacylglyceryl transferase [Aggregatilineales bacterium]HQE19992.1 prolipoprotein diacylglyceryl transferase [Aggregatilineales bacterium]